MIIVSLSETFKEMNGVRYNVKRKLNVQVCLGMAEILGVTADILSEMIKLQFGLLQIIPPARLVFVCSLPAFKNFAVRGYLSLRLENSDTSLCVLCYLVSCRKCAFL